MFVIIIFSSFPFHFIHSILFHRSLHLGPPSSDSTDPNDHTYNLQMKDKLPFEERSKAEHEMYDVANFKGSKESWVLYITDIIQRGEDKYSPYEMMREGLGPEKLPPADAPKEVHDAYWNSISESTL